MPERKSKTIELVKDGNMDEAAVRVQLQRLLRKGIGKTFSRFGWNAGLNTLDNQNGKVNVKLSLYKKLKRSTDASNDVFQRQLDEILEKMALVCSSMGWKFKDEAINQKVNPPQDFNITLPDDITPFFTHLYGVDAQIRIINSSIVAAKASNFKVRNNLLLFGEPGCGKSETLIALEKMIGSHHVVKLNATEMTKAGLEDLIIEYQPVPPLLLIEELEKCNELNLPALLSLLDTRGEIIKTNARRGSIRKEAKCLCIATANDVHKLSRMFNSALSSRFQHKIYFGRPTREVLTKILQREIKAVNGNETWIEPILDYCIDIEKTNDPRRAISLLDGRDKWITGEYRKDLISVREAMERDKFVLS